MHLNVEKLSVNDVLQITHERYSPTKNEPFEEGLYYFEHGVDNSIGQEDLTLIQWWPIIRHLFFHNLGSFFVQDYYTEPILRVVVRKRLKHTGSLNAGMESGTVTFPMSLTSAIIPHARPR